MADVSLENLVLGNIEARVETGDVTLSRRFPEEDEFSSGPGT